ncbi:hypothetical protein BN1013_00366 [Candidatus Rubidus massiliensis]|nr:hypothetical protein BN1013_00366 [Candidatus Rubidus massiliensis]
MLKLGELLQDHFSLLAFFKMPNKNGFHRELNDHPKLLFTTVFAKISIANWNIDLEQEC